MTTETPLQLFANHLNDAVTDNGLRLHAQWVEDQDVQAILVHVLDREEFPITISVDDMQVLCTTPLWREDEIITAQRAELLEALLTMNLPMPLSAFAKLGQQYMLFNALPKQITLSELLDSIEALSDNTLSAVEEFSAYLQQ